MPLKNAKSDFVHAFALSSFMDDGLRTSDGLWILTMSQNKGEALRVARLRADAAKAELDRIIDDLQMSDGIPRRS